MQTQLQVRLATGYLVVSQQCTICDHHTYTLCSPYGARLIVAHALCSLYGADKAKTNFPASEYSHYLGALAANAMAAPPTEPLANASQLVEELQQVVSIPLSHTTTSAVSSRPDDIASAQLGCMHCLPAVI